MNRTPLLSITLLDLRAETRYFISVSAIGPGGEEREIPEQLVFTTKGNGGLDNNTCALRKPWSDVIFR